jgi:hypothetical protein
MKLSLLCYSYAVALQSLIQTHATIISLTLLGIIGLRPLNVDPRAGDVHASAVSPTWGKLAIYHHDLI